MNMLALATMLPVTTIYSHAQSEQTHIFADVSKNPK